MQKRPKSTSKGLQAGANATRDRLSQAVSEAFRTVGERPDSLVRWLSDFAQRDLAEPGAVETARHEVMAFSGRALPRHFIIIGPASRSGLAYADTGDVPEIQTELRKCLRMFSDSSGSGHYWSPPSSSIRYCAQWEGRDDERTQHWRGLQQRPRGLQAIGAEATPLGRFVLSLFTLLSNHAGNIRRCKDCPSLFYARRRDQEYCSRRCLGRAKTRDFRKRQGKERVAANRRDQRKRQRHRKRLKDAGVSAKRISEIVKGRNA
jgi:hypothetical protein